MWPVLPVDGEWLACWLLFGHADNAGRATVRAAQTRAAHAVGPAAHAHALPYLRAHHVPGVHGKDAPVETSARQGFSTADHVIPHNINHTEEMAYLFGDGGVWRDIVGTPVVGVLWLGN